MGLTIQQAVRMALMSRRAAGRIGFKPPCRGQSLFSTLHCCSYGLHCLHFMHALHEMPLDSAGHNNCLLSRRAVGHRWAFQLELSGLPPYFLAIWIALMISRVAEELP